MTEWVQKMTNEESLTEAEWVQERTTLRRQSGKNRDCNKSVVVLYGFFNCIITHAFQELRKVEWIFFWILALIPCVTYEESPKGNFSHFSRFLKLCGFFTKQLLVGVDTSRIRLHIGGNNFLWILRFVWIHRNTSKEDLWILPFVYK